jgi:uncharacterized protein
MSERKVKCPQCGLMTIYTPTNAFRPFCSERCRLIDLGQWADESYKIPVHKESQTYEEENDTQIEPDESEVDS